MPRSLNVDYTCLTDHALLQRFRQHSDADALDVLVRRHHAVVSAVCRQLLGPSQDADDAYQATFLILTRNAGKIRHPHRLSSWLYGVSYRVAMRIRQQRSRRQSIADIADRPTTVDPFVELARRDQLLAIHQAIAALPATLRQPLILRYLEAKTNREVAEELVLTETAVEGRLKRARSRLRVKLARTGLLLSAAMGMVQQPKMGRAAGCQAEQLIEATVHRCCNVADGPTLTSDPAERHVSEIAEGETQMIYHAQLARYTACCLSASAIVATVLTASLLGNPFSTDSAAADSGDAELVVGSVTSVPQTQAKQATPTSTPLQLTQSNEGPFASETGSDESPADGVLETNSASTAAAPASNPPATKPDAEEAAFKRIRTELNQPTKMEFFDEPLLQVINYVEQLHNVPIFLDHQGLDEEGLSSDTPVNFQSKGITLKTALRLMLEQLGLAYTIRDEVLWISTADAVVEQVITRVYSLQMSNPVDPDTITDLMTSHIAPESWQDVGGEGAIAVFHDKLVVTNTVAVHDQVEQLLRKLSDPSASSPKRH